MTTPFPPKQFTTVKGHRLNADPGSILVGTQRAFCRSWPNQQEVTVPGLHFIQEDSGVAIGQAVAVWLSRLD